MPNFKAISGILLALNIDQVATSIAFILALHSVKIRRSKCHLNEKRLAI